MKCRILFFTAIVFASLCVSGCEQESEPSVESLAPAQLEIQGMIPLPMEDRPNMRPNVQQASLYRDPLDPDSVELFAYRGDTSYHPVGLSQRSRLFIGTYYATQDTSYLRRAEKYIRKVMSQCHEVEGALYAPYHFAYDLHSDTNNHFDPPWYSGMAQGEMLTVLSRLYHFTGNQEYLSFAEKVFRTFLRLRELNSAWTVRLDDSLYYWVEEYPHEARPGMTLNGFIYAVHGLYEYYLVSRDDRARLVYDLALTTLKHYLPSFIRGEQGSYYCLGHKFPATHAYHVLHIQQMRELHAITGDPFFLHMAEQFEKRMQRP